jgi:hypothetical protein
MDLPGVDAVLIDNEPGATYEGTVYDRWLTLRHSSGRTLRVFDMSCATGDLSVGSRRFWVLRVSFPEAAAVLDATPTPAIEPGEWMGTIVAINWLAPAQPLALVGAEPTRGQVVIETDVGQVMLGPRDVPGARVGATITWRGGRWDLIGAAPLGPG